MNINEGNIKEITQQVVSDYGFFLVDFNLRGHGKNQVIEVYIDGMHYINADDCSRVSREINERLQNIIPDEFYRLDVSSPGIDRPLKFIDQFPKHLNKKFDLAYRQDADIKKINAVLIEVTGNELKFLTNDKKEIIIKFEDIIKAKVLVSF